MTVKRNVTPITARRTSRPAITANITIRQYQALMAAIETLPDRIADRMEQRGQVPPRWDMRPDTDPQWADEEAPF